MRLADLNPRWYSFYAGGPRAGLTFECPHCRTERLGVSFHHKGRELIEDAEIHLYAPNEKIWTLEGDTFETASITPSIDASGVGHWHGYITGGECT